MRWRDRIKYETFASGEARVALLLLRSDPRLHSIIARLRPANGRRERREKMFATAITAFGRGGECKVGV